MGPRAFLVLLCCLPLAAQPFGTNLSGRPVEHLATPGSRAVVLFFAASDCPISNRYIPEIERLDREFAPDGLRFWWVYPNPDETADVIRRHQEQFHIEGHPILDTEQQLVRMAHATVTPEVALLIPAGAGFHEVYRGRIDNRYLALGRERPSATQHDLEEAIQAVLSDRTVPPPGGPAVGCSIMPRNLP